MKKVFKNFLLCLACTVVLILTGINTMNSKVTNETKKSSYTSTTFEYVILSPSREQLTELKGKEEAINSIFPCYSFDANLTGNKKNKINLLLADDMTNYSISLFNDETKISGNYDKDGLLLDERAAKMLNVNVGDKVSASLAGYAFDFTVSAIYMASSYSTFEDGLGLAYYNESIKEAFNKELPYDYAFIDAKDKNKCANELKNYIPLALLQSEADYIKEYKENNNLPHNMTEEEWNVQIKKAYEEYKNNYLSQDFESSVQDKAIFMEDIKDQISSSEKAINYLCIGVAVVSIIFYAFLSILFISQNSDDDRTYLKDGKKHIFKKYSKNCYINTILIAAITFVALFIFSLRTHFSMELLPISLMFSLPILVAIIPIQMYIKSHKKVLEKIVKADKKREEELRRAQLGLSFTDTMQNK